MMKRLIPLIPLCTVLLVGCTGPGLRAPQIVEPVDWSLDAGTVKPDWAGLLDPQLADLQARALSANRDIAQAALRWRQAQLLADQTKLRWQPSASLSTSVSRPVEDQRSSRTVDVGGISVPVTTSVGISTSYGASVGVGYEWDLWNRLSHTSAVESANVEAARSDIDAARLLIRSRVAESYWTLAAISEQFPLAQQQVKLATENVTLVRQRVIEGKLLPLEIDKAANSLQSVRSHLSDLEADARQQRHTLALLLAEPPPGPTLNAPHLPSKAPATLQLRSPAQVLSGRPDVQRARMNVDAALARLRASEADRYPRLSFSGGISTGGTVSRDWLSQPLASLAGNLVVPLIDWRRLDMQRDSNRTELEAAALALRETLAKAMFEIESQRIDANRLALQVDASAARLRESREAERLAVVKYEVGVIARADLLQVQIARLDVEQGLVQLRLRQWLNQAQLYKALGDLAADGR